MFNNIIKIANILFIILFSFFISFSYLSEKNINKIKSNRININQNYNKNFSNLPKLKNDTDQVIVYFSEKITEKKIKKRKFWELLNKNE